MLLEVKDYNCLEERTGQLWLLPAEGELTEIRELDEVGGTGHPVSPTSHKQMGPA